MLAPPLLVQLLALVLIAPTSADDKFPSPQGRFLLKSKTCPRSCDDAKDISGWSAIHDLKGLAVCPEPVLLTYNLYTDFDNPETLITIRACTLGDASTEENYLTDTNYISPDAPIDDFSPVLPPMEARQVVNETLDEGAICGKDSPKESEVSAILSTWENADMNGPDVAIIDSADSQSGVANAISRLAAHMRKDNNNCGKHVTFTYVRGTLVGLYAGTLVDKRLTSAALLQTLSDAANGAGTSGFARRAIEVCDKNRTSSETFGAVVDTSGDFGALQKIMRDWNEGKCITSDARGKVEQIQGLRFWGFDIAAPEPIPQLETRSIPYYVKRATCTSIRVQQDDGCATLAARCGIGSIAFENFNKATPNLCSTLMPGQPVCCSSGDLPDIKPKPQSDGTCAVYEVQADEGCQVVAAKHGLKQTDLDDFNKETWGWDGCGNLQLLQRVCVSTGKPPMPATYWDAVCGPTKEGSKPPTDGTKLADINPCPLNVCCNVWGKCGTTDDFCTISNTTTMNPGTSKPGENGCQSSCGREIVNNKKGPDVYRKIGYFEAWNGNRACLKMDVTEVHSSYTHVHFAFGEISASLQPLIPTDQQAQWTKFTNAQGYKKILAYGGWAFSNEGPQTGRFREAFQPGNRNAFADAVVKHAVDNKLDGVDFDWEYPGATDIEGSDPGREEDGENYYQFLKLVRDKMPKSMSLSIATPASYWYLKGFPIKKMAEVLDYLVYMTYDFHGQWDVGNKWSMEGCEAGNCLRSHVNSTITQDALVMITKAGVESHKVVVGVTSYGRSFKMTDSNCRGPMCTFEGARNQSPAKKGRCTDTGGYISNFEINEIKNKGGAIKAWYDAETDSDYLVYERVEWVAYMSDLVKTNRMKKYKDLNMGGTSDWAIDLQGGGSGGGNLDPAPPYFPDPNDDKPLEPCYYTPKTMDEINNLDFRNELPAHCGTKYLIDVLRGMLADARKRFNEILADDYEKYFKIFAQYVVSTAGSVLADYILNNGGKYYNCKVTAEYACCTGCAGLGLTCKGCIDDKEVCKVVSPWGETGKRWATRDGPCPQDYSNRGTNGGRFKYESVFFSFKNDEAKQTMYDDILAEVGVPEKRIEIVDHQMMYWHDFDYQGCYGYLGPVKPWPELSEVCQHENWWHGAPRSKGFVWEDVFNPKNIIEETFKNIDIDDALAQFSLEIQSDEYKDNDNDLIDALLIPIFMIHAGLDHMEVVVDMAKDIEQAERDSFILNLLSAIFFVVGGAGGIIANAGFRALGRILVGLAELGNTGLGLHTAVSTPESIPLLIFGLVMSGRAIREVGNVGKAAKLRRDMKFEEIADLSKEAGRLSRIAEKANKAPAFKTQCRYA